MLLNSLNTVTIRGEISDHSMTTAAAQLATKVIRRGAAKYPIFIVLDSPGGSIDSGNMFIEFAKTLDNVHTITLFSASMASAIVEQLPGKRLITENGVMMFHRAYAGVEGQVEVGELEIRLDMIKKLVRKMELLNAGRMGITLESYKSKVVNELWLDSDDSVAQKVSDLKVDIVCSQELVAAKDVLIVRTFFGGVKFTFSKCPLFRAPGISSDSRVKYQVPSLNFNRAKQSTKGN